MCCPCLDFPAFRTSRTFFLRLVLVANFPALDTDCMFSRVSHRPHVLLTLGSSCLFSRSVRAQVVCFPALATSLTSLLLALLGSLRRSDCLHFQNIEFSQYKVIFISYFISVVGFPSSVSTPSWPRYQHTLGPRLRDHLTVGAPCSGASRALYHHA